MSGDSGENNSVETDLTCPPGDDDLSEVQDRHELLLVDIQPQTMSMTSRHDDCLSAIAVAGFADCAPVILDAVQSIKNGSSDWTTLRNNWKAEYIARRRKATKENLRSQSSGPSLVAGSSDARTDISSIRQLSFDPMDYTHITSVPSSIVRHQDFSPSASFMIIADHAFNSSSDSPLSMLITGPAGSGKSQVLTALQDLFSARNECRRLRVASYMGIAANNVAGVALHSALNLTPALSSLQSPSSKYMDDLKYMWSGVEYLFIVEVSVIRCEFLHTISTMLMRATGRSLPFGGLTVIVAGDMAQLPPVAEARLSAWIDPTRASASDRSQRKLKGKILWLSVTTVVMLDKINRHSGVENVPFVDLLSRLREGNCNFADYRLLQSRLVSPQLNIQQWNLGINDFAPIIATDNTTKDAVNMEIARIFATKTSQSFDTYAATDEMDGSPITDPSLLQIIDLLHSGRTSNRLKRLPLVLGMPVMITANIDLQGGIVNGTIGTVRAIDFSTLPNGERVLNHCIVHIPSARAAPMTGLGEFAILPDTVSIRYQGSKSKQSLSFKRTQLPPIPAFAMTAHKSQGQTMDKAIIDLANCHGTMAPYVMVSRLDDLLILRPFPMAKITCRMSEDTRREQKRIRVTIAS